jgi:hypothetical protein
LNTRLLTAAVAVALIAAGARQRVVQPPKPAPPAIDIRRSLVITEPDILQGFELQRVLQTLIDRSGATTTTPLSLYRQWFDTQNPKPGLAVADAPHCDDFLTNGKPSFNGFPRRCPTSDGILAKSDPFTAHDYTPVGITNRFDLTPADGSNCGQYRIVYAKSGLRLRIIFEAVLPNPNPAAGVEGCRAVAEFWANLSSIDSTSDRRALIEQFFYDGFDGFAPVLRPEHFAPGAGRIRTSQFSPVAFPRFYQFQLQRRDSRLLVVPGLLENLPYGSLYNAAANQPLGPEYRTFFVSQVATLAIPDVNGFYDNIPEKYLMHESDPENQPLAWQAITSFTVGTSTEEGKAFKAAIAAELQRAGSGITADNVITRADMLNCNNCHGGGPPIGDGMSFPKAFEGGVHIDDTLETVGNAPRFGISPALRDVFAPHRAQVLRDFLAHKPLPVHSNGTIGGGRASD